MQHTEKQTPKMPSPEELEKMMVVPAFVVPLGVIVLQVLIYGLPAAAIAMPLLYSPGLWFTIGMIIIAPLAYAFLFGVVAGVLSIPFQAGIIKGVFPRDVRFPIYTLRRLYGICWTSVYYFKPIYGIILSIPFFKTITFRLFGYKGSMKFTIYPDTWLRDLPLITFEEGAYVANRSTLGSNVCLLGGNIMVHKMTLRKGAMFGHLSVSATGLTIGEYSEIEAQCAVGVHVKIGNNSIIGSKTGISHYVRIGNNTKIGVRSFIGTGTTIGDNLHIPSDTQFPDKVQILTQADVDRYVKLPISGNTNMDIHHNEIPTPLMASS